MYVRAWSMIINKTAIYKLTLNCLAGKGVSNSGDQKSNTQLLLCYNK